MYLVQKSLNNQILELGHQFIVHLLEAITFIHKFIITNTFKFMLFVIKK